MLVNQSECFIVFLQSLLINFFVSCTRVDQIRIFNRLHDETGILDGNLQCHWLTGLCKVCLRLPVLDNYKVWLNIGALSCFNPFFNPLIGTIKVLSCRGFWFGVVSVRGGTQSTASASFLERLLIFIYLFQVLCLHRRLHHEVRLTFRHHVRQVHPLLILLVAQ